MRIKQTPEEKDAKQKAANKVYRDNMTPEQKAKVAEQKRLHSVANNERITERRKLYYELNKEHMKATSKAYHQKIRDEIKAKRDAGIDVPKTIYAPRGKRLKKVVAQPANMTTVKEIAQSIGLHTAKFRSMLNDKMYKFPEPTMLRIDGIELYDIVIIGEWIRLHKEAITHATITGASKKNIGEITIGPHIMLLVNWLQASKHVTKYCNAQRVAINSNQFWSRWA